MSEWREVTLGDVLTLQRGFDLPARARVDGPVPIVSSSGITGFHSVPKVQPPGVVIGRYGSLGSVHWIDQPFWPLNTSLWVKDFKGNDARFVSYLLRTVSVDGSAASAVPGVNRNHLHRRLVRCPSFNTQRRIAAIFAAFDELIEINERRIELLESLARSLYREWFVRFWFPGHETGGLVDSEVGRIPEGWTVGRLGDLVEFRYGKALPARTRRAGPYPVVSSAGVVDTHSESLVAGPGIVVGRKGNVGSIWWVPDDFFPIDTTYYVTSELSLGFLYWLLQDVEFLDSHAAIPGLSRDQALGQRVVVPERRMIERFVKVHDACFASIAAARETIRALAHTRDLLLPRLVTGRLDVSDVDLGDLLPAEVA